MPFYRDYKILADDAILQCRADRQSIRPYGLFGGRAGRPGESFVDPDGERRQVTSKVTMEAKKGDVFRYILPGGGGWGDPLERDPAAVLRDLRNGIVSTEAAGDDYGVVIDAETWRVDEAATTARRAALKAARREPLPDVIWDDERAESPFGNRSEKDDTVA